MAKSTLKGQIGVTTENIFPVIKQFLYSDHEIFLRELVANAVDASQKMKAVASGGEFSGELGELKVEVALDEKGKTLKIIDHGIGMTSEEVDKYINQIAFSSAGEFLEKYKDQVGIIGHFGLGFYSAFMVSKKVTIETLSWKEGAKGVFWSCDGSPEYEMNECKKAERGTVITLYLDSDAEEFASKGRISELLGKYCKFMPVPVVFGKKTEWKDGKSVESSEDNVINSVEPIWTKAPSELKDEDYLEFYKALYPIEEDPMFHIHLNVDYPFNLTGVLYFPKIKERMAIDKHKIQLYCNQMFVTDHVDNIVPEFLTLLHGVIDSPDIPLNVSRSYLQADANVKKISAYITKKVADRLEEIFKEQRETFEQKWDNIKLFIEYGMLSDEKFCERAVKFALLKDTEGKYYSFDEYTALVGENQKDKDGKTVILYASNAEEQYTKIAAAQAMGYNVLLMDCELDAHFVGLLEQKLKDVRCARVDSDAVGNLIPKEDAVKPQMSEEDAKSLSDLFKAALPTGNEYQVEACNLGAEAAPVLITQNEFMRRYREMSAVGGGMNFYGSMPEMYDIKVNMENPLIAKIWEDRQEVTEASEEGSEKAATKYVVSDLMRQVVDLALLGAGLLKGKALAEFISRTEKTLSA
ncbi:MAG: molecular chaperone HtpG [Bacteroidales bacterium]|nr:molecular chaperone HtpG [Bacteroidales bacterium]